MKKYISKGLLAAVTLAMVFMFGSFINATPVSAQTSTSANLSANCKIIETLIGSNIISADRANSARSAFNCPIPVVPTICSTIEKLIDLGVISSDKADFARQSFNCSSPVNPPVPPVACATDVFQCPAGPIVGRTGPNCEFVCPTKPPVPVKTVKIIGFPVVSSTVEPGQPVNLSFTASDSNGDNLVWSFNWGENISEVGACPANQPNTSVSREHTWANAGKYTVTVKVNDCNGNGDSYSFVINVGQSGGPLLSVLSPNGGETWQKGTKQSINWLDRQPIPPTCANCGAPVPRAYDIKLFRFQAPCTKGMICPDYVSAPYTIANGVSVFPYTWNVGTVQSTGGSGLAVSAGSYVVEICKVGSDICDSSDSYFKITDGGSTNQPPVINGVVAPTTLNVGEVGTWSVQASDPENGPLSYSVDWGDCGGYGCDHILNGASPAVIAFIQTSTFTHSYSVAGTYTVSFTVRDDAGQVAKRSTTVVVSSEPRKGNITVLSPNGGETWPMGSKQSINWQDNTPNPTCTVNSNSSSPSCINPTPSLYDIKLLRFQSPCTGGLICPGYVLAPYIIANSVSGYSYSWTVGSIKDLYDALIGSGSYTIEICKVGSDICDSSDSYFKITDGGSTNQPPVINGGTAPASLNVGEVGTWSVQASDPENGPLSYSVDWGDVHSLTPQYIALNEPFIQTSTFTHSYSAVGTYTVSVTVRDNAGQTAKTSSTVVVGSEPQKGNITVLSPNGGEYWVNGNVQTIKWSDPVSKPPVCITGPNMGICPQYISPAPRFYDIWLMSVCSSGAPCMTLPQSIAKSVGGMGYDWKVNAASDHNYNLEVCSAGSFDRCDLSDSYFKIVDNKIEPPIIATTTPSTPIATTTQETHTSTTTSVVPTSATAALGWDSFVKLLQVLR